MINTFQHRSNNRNTTKDFRGSAYNLFTKLFYTGEYFLKEGTSPSILGLSRQALPKQYVYRKQPLRRRTNKSNTANFNIIRTFADHDNQCQKYISRH